MNQKDSKNILKKMNVKSDAIIINQSAEFGYNGSKPAIDSMLNILHVGHIENSQFNGVAVVVPNYLKYQSDYANIALLNIANYIPEGSEDIYQTYFYDGNINSLKAPFNTPDLVVFHEVYYPPFATIAKELTKRHIPYIITPHVSLTETAQRNKRFKKIIGNTLIFNKFVENAAAIHFLSTSEKLQSSHYNRLPSFICNNGIELNGEQKTQFSKHGLKLIYVGRYEIKIKGIDRILDMIDSAKDEMRQKGVTIDLYGYDESNNLKWINDTIRKYGISDIVTAEGPLYGKNKFDAIRKHDCFIQLSRTEGQPLAVMEAMEIGMPCIVTKGTTFAGIARSHGVGIPVGDNPAEIGKVIIGLTRNKELLRRVSEQASSYAKKEFSWPVTASRMIKEYGKLLSIKNTDL